MLCGMRAAPRGSYIPAQLRLRARKRIEFRERESEVAEGEV
jgi:hypothetical protein